MEDSPKNFLLEFEDGYYVYVDEKTYYAKIDSDQLLAFCKDKYPKNYRNYIVQKGNIDGKFVLKSNDIKTNIELHDLSGYTKGSLKDVAQLLNVPIKYKDSCNEFKSCMERNFENYENTIKFVNYSIEDCILLEGIKTNMELFMNSISENILQKKIYKNDSLSKTLGSIVAKFTKEFIYIHSGRGKSL